jgi:hypothetical protein
MLPETKNCALLRGEDRDMVVTVLDDAGAPVNLAGTSLHYRVARYAERLPVLSIDTDGMTVQSNVVTITITAAQSAALGPHTYYHELYQTVNGQRRVLMRGSLELQDAQAAQHPADD